MERTEMNMRQFYCITVHIDVATWNYLHESRGFSLFTPLHIKFARLLVIYKAVR